MSVSAIRNMYEKSSPKSSVFGFAILFHLDAYTQCEQVPDQPPIYQDRDAAT